jgi:1-deoxy-D-xylulose-5-phosphate synthase
LAIRYPRAGKVIFEEKSPIIVGKWEHLHRSSSKLTVIATGERCLILAMKILQKLQPKGIDFDVVNARFVKPLDEDFLNALQSEYVITLEDNVLLGGLGSMINNYLIKQGKSTKIKNFAYVDKFIPHGGVSDLQEEYGLSQKEIEEYILKVCV